MVAGLTDDMVRLASCLVALLTLVPVVRATAQEAVSFGDWRAFCAPVAGCVLGVKSGQGDTLAFVESPFEDRSLLLLLAEPVQGGSEIALSFDGRFVVALGPADGWRLIDSGVGPAVQIAPSIVRDGLMEPMRRRDRLDIVYRLDDGRERRVAFSLSGYADTRGYADDG